MCVIGALFLLPVILVFLIFLLNKNSMVRANFGEDFRTIFNKFMHDIHNQTQRGASSSTGDGVSTREALEILGLESGASRDQIISAYHRLMKNTHPDKGGSAYFAQKLNQARDRLLNKK
ncbi:J domain-containing protein [Candidatus Anaplasma sp. TIGMIC]|uniref:J domain-containing protein n=1 Tax=Candidatus Anaplasma sp. TIGMIC TaxID=3020713 RepID=UPI00232E38A5|nr:DnaJ domain-containing protein [Candidatus Anaplasma sp. TIGMIC]